MPDTFTQLHIQLVFAVKHRQSLIDKDWQMRLHQYMTGIIENNRHKMLQVNSMPDHLHLLIGLRPHQSLSALVQNLKAETSKWINANRFCPVRFAWQEGYGAFSYSKSHVDRVIRYIQNQQIHHQRESFLEEYTRLLKAFEIDYEAQYIFKEPL